MPMFHLDWPAKKKTPTSPAFPFKTLHFRQVEPDLWGSFFAGQPKWKIARSKGHKTDTDGKDPYRLYQFCVLLTFPGIYKP